MAHALPYSSKRILLFGLSFAFLATADLSPRAATTTTDLTTAVITVTTVVPEPTGKIDPSYTNYTDFIFSALNSTNLYRYEHNATAVVWNESMAEWSAHYAAQASQFAHSGRNGVGENIVSGAGDVTAGIDAFGNERAQYHFSSPGFSEGTGHFTQLVWKSTTSVGCGASYRNDPGNGLYGVFMVCQYYPPGNVGWGGSDPNMLYKENVQRQVNNGGGYVPDQVKVEYDNSAATATNTMGPGPTGGNMMGDAAGIFVQSGSRWWWALVASFAALALAGDMA